MTPQGRFLEDRSSIFYKCVEQTHEPIMITDSQGILVYVNQAWQRVYGYAWEEAVGSNPRLLRSGKQDDEFYRKMWLEITKTGRWVGELVNRAKDGREVPVLLTITPYRDDEGRIQGYMGTALDTTEKKQMEAQLLQQDRLASVGMLASGLAHEVGTPMGVIRGRAEYLLMMAGENESMKRSLQIIVSQIDRISRLIYSLLNFSRSGNTEVMTSVAVCKVAEELDNLMREKLARQSIDLKWDIPQEMRILGDPQRLEQVLLNLVMNSLHAIETAIEKGRSTEHFIWVKAKRSGDYWDLVVEDSGCGIPESNRSKLFKPFFTTKDVGKGTGLGLAITLQIIQSWNGSIRVDSQEGVGTSFHLHLPAATAPAAASK